MKGRNALVELLGIEVPVVQAPIGSACTPALAAAVSNAGGLGMLALTWHSPDQAVETLRETRRLTSRPFGANLVLDFPIDDQLSVILDEGLPIVSTFWGEPASAHAKIRAAGALHLHTVGSVAEAKEAADIGVDAIVAQGWEAGGHVRGIVSTMSLVPSVVDAVSPIPVIAAGGIADGRGLAAALTLGAHAVMIGTRFLGAVEAATHEVYRAHVLTADASDAVYTRCFDGGWPNAPHRALHNRTMAAWQAAGEPRSPHRPGENDVVASDVNGSYRRYEDRVPLAGMTGQVDDLAMYAGQSAGLVREVSPAADIVTRLIEEARTAMTACPIGIIQRTAAEM
jgi:NAD(P)H-dependent flavin oxidoreductase YrpB (nitropropane dioxygenase family)